MKAITCEIDIKASQKFQGLSTVLVGGGVEWLVL